MSHPLPDSDSKPYPSIKRTVSLLVLFFTGILSASESETEALAGWLLREQSSSPSHEAVRPAVNKDLRPLVELLETPEQAVLETFRQQIGQEVEVELRSGSVVVVPRRVENGVIYVERRAARGSTELALSLSDFSFREILKRCAQLPPPRNFLLGGWVYLRAGENGRRWDTQNCCTPNCPSP